MIHPAGREQAGMHAGERKKKKVGLKRRTRSVGHWGKSHEKIKGCETKMEKQRHGR